MKNVWWKLLAVILVMYTVLAGFMSEVPRMNILGESIRNLYFHVGMWFAMILMMLTSMIFSIRFLKKSDEIEDIKAIEASKVGFVLGLLGLSTGMVWAKYTWGAWWVNDPKLNGTLISLLIYTAYYVLRSAIEDDTKRARLSAVYNIFAFVMLIVFVGVLPRMSDSLHPGNGGNPAFGNYDLDSGMKMVFYPAVIGWILLSTWILQIKIRSRKIEYTLDQKLKEI
ncbi:MAG: heme exporter protein C [Flavobacteriales bacterium]|jgi:heme exporter protein C